jgi:hypothetical protein
MKTGDNASKSSVQCRKCKHLIIWPYCFAFLTGSGIPHELREGKFPHTKPFPGDHGIRFLHADSPYELPETALKKVIAAYRGEIVMPDLRDGTEKIPGEGSPHYVRESEQRKMPADLMEACIEGNIEAARKFLKRGDDINIKDSHGNTPLMHACRNCNVDLVKLLVKNGCDVTITDKYSKRAIDIAQDWGYPSIVEILKKLMEHK